MDSNSQNLLYFFIKLRTLNTQQTDATSIQVSPSFRKAALQAVLNIILFLFVYLLLFTAALMLAGSCLYAGLALILAKPSFITLLAGGGIAISGVMIVFFLIKFLFSTRRADVSDSIRIMPEDQPLLFDSLRKLTREIGTPMPKKVFLSPDVNASVFYDSSFWSLFLPVRKNLKIGIGLVNALNVSELEAVIAHEFGHFAQKSMKVGSWVYQVNRIIYDMLYNNDGLARSINAVANVHWIIALFIRIAVKIMEGIQFILRKMYALVNKSYMGLSREMEFHADHVAAHARGSNNIIHALLRIDFAETAYGHTIEHCNRLLKEQKTVHNFYAGHRANIRQMASILQTPVQEGLPLLRLEKQGSSRIQYKDQWSSHPTTQERHEYLQPFQLNGPVDQQPAWTLFQQKDSLAATLTQKIYPAPDPEQPKTEITDPAFLSIIEEDWQENRLDNYFKGYFDRRWFDITNIDSNLSSDFGYLFPGPFPDDMAMLPKEIRQIENEESVLSAIQSGDIDVRTFDFNGQKRNKQEAGTLLKQVSEERISRQQALENADRGLFLYAAHRSEAFDLNLKRYLSIRQSAAQFSTAADAIIEKIEPFYSSSDLTKEIVESILHMLKTELEPTFKKELNNWLDVLSANKDIHELALKYLESDYQYFDGRQFIETDLQDLNQLLREGWSAIVSHLFIEFKELTRQLANQLQEPVAA